MISQQELLVKLINSILTIDTNDEYVSKVYWDLLVVDKNC
jgi:hypothetical protein